MKQCVHCHSEIEENRTICPFCGGSQATYQQQNNQYQQPQYQQYQPSTSSHTSNSHPEKVDIPSFLKRQ